MDQRDKTAASSEPWLQVQGSRHFLDWLAEMRVSLAFSTYQTGKVFFVGRKLDMCLAVFERTFNHCMGLWASPDGRTLWLSSKFQIWRFEQAAATAVPYRPASAEGDDAGIPAWAERGYDVAYVPRIGMPAAKPRNICAILYNPLGSRRFQLECLADEIGEAVGLDYADEGIMAERLSVGLRSRRFASPA